MNFNFKNGNFDLFNPLIVVVMAILFLIIAMPMWYFYQELPSPNLDLYLYIGLGLLFFIFSAFASNYILSKSFKIDVDSTPKKIFSTEKLSLFDSYSKNELIIVALVLLGILLQVINIALLGGIPLFSATLKAKAATKIWLVSYIIFLLSINVLLAKYNRKSHYLLLLIGLVLFALTGYRTTPIAIMLSALITLYYTRDIDVKYIILAILAIAVVLLAVGFIAVQAITWQHWSLNPIELVSYRAAFTLNILSKAIENQCATMGNLFYTTLTGFFTHSDARVLVGQATLGQVHSITSTIFGPALLDFGIVGMILQMFLLGLILKTLHSIQNYKKEIFTAFYGILLAQTIIWIETGPTDIVVWLFYLIGIFLIIHFLRGANHEI
ncbi:MAG: oligosaccharide repeat unit polymerase family protein [Methanobrevibacter ruminantium]|uniref:oligosaccharide repeat unit polymerase family protein n=1 Tax=Methanobrevibacter ruminantium TaxID=83816 RepID=UPI0026E947B6|nr:oligosaccharide repeat unit polymerase family protein [Methanobrevibacter ruminantium]MDD6048758.1 oligosaccharide repeat unit polymerase family protein [Methanobrevibacter ruminantium]